MAVTKMSATNTNLFKDQVCSHIEMDHGINKAIQMCIPFSFGLRLQKNMNWIQNIWQRNKSQQNNYTKRVDKLQSMEFIGIPHLHKNTETVFQETFDQPTTL
jgi:hypothetical protein